MEAEKIALSLCNTDTTLHHLLVVPTFWKDMTGDDWLTNGSTRNQFRRYLESELGKEVDEHCERISSQAKALSVTYTNELIVGEPEQCLLNACQKQNFKLVVMGSPRPKGKHGLRSRMSTGSLFRSLSVPLLIVPYPQ